MLSPVAMRRLSPVILLAALASCGITAEGKRSDAPASAEQTTAPALPAPAEDPGSPAAPSPWDEDPPCPQAPCAARPIVFVHGHRGSNSDWATVTTALAENDPRWDGARFAGTKDHTAWPTRSIGRREWLFVFDYYVRNGNDARESYTAGHGRIGSGGAIVGDAPAYDAVDHEYAADLAALVDDVLRATGAKKIDLVGHSMGGLVARSFMAFHGGNAKVETLLLAASPHAGIGLVGFAALFGIGPDWMPSLEIAELDSGSALAKVRFLRPGEPDSAKGSWTAKLLDVETKTPIAAAVHVMSGSKDLAVSYDAAHHPAAKTHVVVDTDHSGILKAPETIQRVRDLCGGSYP